jgi:hypothetical protein
MIVNIKSEGIEVQAKNLLDKFQIKNYFFLDSTIPMIVKLGQLSGYNFALRVSIYESIKSAISLNKFAKWIWVDCFSGELIAKEELLLLKKSGFNLCFVSPELHNTNLGVKEFVTSIHMLGIKPEMVCSKLYNYELWNEIFIK